MKTRVVYTLEEKMDYYENRIATAREELTRMYGFMEERGQDLEFRNELAELEDKIYFFRARLFTIYTRFAVKGLVRPSR